MGWTLQTKTFIPIMWTVIIITVILGTCGSVSGRPEPLTAESWDILKLTQTWPPAGCIFLENDHKECNISNKMGSWIIHGLWPTKRDTEGPNFCNNTWKFDLSKVQSLRPELDTNWPSITLHEKSEDTWDHEWTKHGTCAASLPALKSEFNYFNVTLGLHSKYDLYKMLYDHTIEPNERKYRPEDILTALKDSLGHYPSITCVYQKSSGMSFMEQVEICLDKSFRPVDCDASKSLTDESASSLPGSSLLFHSEAALKEHALKKYLNDCPYAGVYYKPFASPLSRPTY